MNETWRFELAAHEADERLDRVLVARRPDLGRRGATALFAEGRVRAAGKRVAKSARCEAGTRIEVEPPAPRRADPDPAAPLDVRLERDELVVVLKRAGQPSAPRAGRELGSLASALLGRYPELAGVGRSALEPGLVHRLDTGTSGLLLAARDTATLDALIAALGRDEIVKAYLAVVPVAGLPDRGVIDAPLAPHPKDARRVVAVSGAERGARPARSAFEVVRRGTRNALVEITVHRALRHQIRAHFAHLGHPLVGDVLYGGSAELSGRHALHASRIAWAGDRVRAAFDVRAALPPELDALLA